MQMSFLCSYLSNIGLMCPIFIYMNVMSKQYLETYQFMLNRKAPHKLQQATLYFIIICKLNIDFYFSKQIMLGSSCKFSEMSRGFK